MNSVEMNDSINSRSMLSFKISSKVKEKNVVNGITSNEFYKDRSNNELNEDNDYLLTVDKDGLKSSKPQSVHSQLTIPMITQNKWNYEGSKHDEISRLAAKEILTDLELEEENCKNETSLPILMKNRLPPPKDGADMDERYDISLRPDESTMEDYESIPISSFGTAMLRGMGWEKGGVVGLTNKGLCEPIEFIPRHKGLGLGAQKKKVEELQSKKRKLGESADDGKRFQPIIEKDGRVRHVKRLGEVASEEQPKGFCPGYSVIILKEPHKDLYGKIISVDEDTARISVKLSLSGELIHLSQHNACLVDKIPPKHEVAANTVKLDAVTAGRKCNGNKVKKQENLDGNLQPINWIERNIRVRIISRSFKNGRYYNKKVKIIDVTNLNTCTCRTDENKILEDVHENYLETVVPKTKGSYVFIVIGKYKGKFAKLLERNKDDYKATVQLTSNKHITNLRYDFFSEYVGELPDDEFL